MKKVLVITNQDDLHASNVISNLHDLGRPVFRLNTEEILTSYRFSMLQSKGRSAFKITEKETGRVLDLDSLGVVYFRRPAEIEAPKGLDDQTGRIVESETKQFLTWLYIFLEEHWLFGSLHAMRRANSKPLQARVAVECGFDVPDTFWGNDSTVAAELLRSHGRIAIKSIREMGYVKNERYHSFYTNLVDSTEIASDSAALEINTNFLQQAIEKQYELRITYVDGRIIPVKIDSQWADSPANDDWRKVWWDQLPHAKAELPPEIENRIHHYMQCMKLRFGALDFIVMEDGRYVFLECNPNGQWLWLDEMVDAGIGKAIASALHSHCDRPRSS